MAGRRYASGGRYRKATRRQRTRRLRVEPLEPRWLLAGLPIISEFLASNQQGLQDSAGNRWDWIEIYNRADQAADLAGWQLKDSHNAWVFPAVSLGPHASRIIFASGLDRRDPGGELHTNFKLSQEGEYLGLLDPAGAVVHEFAPQYPPQQDDISYGIGQEVVETTLVPSGAAARYAAPADNSLGSSWIQPSFDDTAWQAGATGLGFAARVPGFAVETCTANSEIPDLATALAILTKPSLQTAVATETAPTFNYLNAGSSGHFGEDQAFPGVSNDRDVDWFVTQATGTVRIPAAGDWTFGVNSDDGFRLQIGAQSLEYPGLRGADDSYGVFHFPASGDYDLSLTFFENYGGASAELFGAPGSYSGWDATSDWRLVGDVAHGGLAVTSTPWSGNGSGAAFARLVATDVKTELAVAGQTSLYTRIAFDVSDPAALESLTLKMQYDDGYVAWLNGVEIARRNVPLPVATTWCASPAPTKPNTTGSS